MAGGCFCPCSPCYVCNHRFKTSAPCPTPNDTIAVHCCLGPTGVPICVPCRLCVTVLTTAPPGETSTTCIGGCATVSPVGVPLYMDFYDCHFEASVGPGAAGEDVWEWRLSNGSIVCPTAAEWNVVDIRMQCRKPRALGAAPYWQLYTPGGGVGVYCGTAPPPATPLPNLAWLPVTVNCGPPFVLEATGQLAPGFPPCFGCFLRIRIGPCETVCGCLPALPSRLYATITRIVTPGSDTTDLGFERCACFVGLTWPMDYATQSPPGVTAYYFAGTPYPVTGHYSDVINLCGGGSTIIAGITRDMFALLQCIADPLSGTARDYELILRGGIFPTLGCMGHNIRPHVSSTCSPVRFRFYFSPSFLCCTGFLADPTWIPPVMEIEVLP